MATSIMVTGLSGLVGQRFAQLYGHKYNFENLDLTAGVDITNSQQLEEMICNSKASTIIHLAAFTNVSMAHEQEGNRNGLCYMVNVVGTANVIAAARKSGKYVIHVSTDFVFDGTKDGEYTEADLPNPIEWYGKTKLLAEKEVNQYENAIILRISYPYQANPARPDFLEQMIDRLREGVLPPPFADHIITPTFTDDVAKVFDYCIDHQPKGLYHAVGSSHLSDYEIAKMVNQVFELNAEIKPGSLAEYLKTTKRPYQKQLKTSNQKLTHDFGIKMATIREGLEKVKNNKD